MAETQPSIKLWWKGKSKSLKPNPAHVSHNSTPKKNEGKQEYNILFVPRNLHDPPSLPSIHPRSSNIPFHFIRF